MVALAVAPAAVATGEEEAVPAVTFARTGAEQVVFDYDAASGGSCDTSATGDLPDAAARAFRDAAGKVHLIATHHRHWASISTGTSLDSVARDCAHMIYEAGNDPDPATYDNRGWLESFYTLDGRTIHALVAMDYHPRHYDKPCGTMPADASRCWYGTTVQATSTDGGYSFTSPAPGTPRFIAGVPYQADPAVTATGGAFVPSNIVVGPDGALYATLSMEPRELQAGGTCLIRTTAAALGNPAAWRAWDGDGFDVQFASPYPSVPDDPENHVCTPVGVGRLQRPVRSLIEVEGHDLYIAISHGVLPGDPAIKVLASTSTNLVDWTPPQAVMDLPRYGQNGESCSTHSGAVRYQYPSLLDPQSTSRNFNTTGTTAYIYATRVAYCAGFNRDLVRIPISITVS
ncbi:hypothetical protein DY240_01120 [Jiangella rhizosphaerae]|uniref:Exo-alpha-sialidase n=1 Tax=Jiangella rhizosphaerae TaxID=2293569 RepID=A0A418KY34_9ACTN|nr:hypothetical protein DY240_01120 [Jiangella rhizosphaerae]